MMKRTLLLVFVLSLTVNVFGGMPDRKKAWIDSLVNENRMLNAKIDALASQVKALSLYLKELQSSISVNIEGLQSSINELANAQSSKNVLSGVCGENVHWNLNTDTGVLEIIGSGDMVDFADENQVPWHDYASSIFTLLLSDGITHIGDYAFCKCTGLKQPTIPTSVTSIGNHSFESCTKLDPVVPNSVTTIGKCAFKGCALTSFVIPSSVKVISIGMFANSSITSISIPSGVTTIAASAFSGCKLLEQITLPSGVTTIGAYAFYGCESLARVIIPTGVRSIDEGTFAECKSLKHITLPSGIKYIGEQAFTHSGLEEIIIPEGVTKIDWQAFEECTSLKKASLPSSLRELQMAAFRNCKNLTNANVPRGVKMNAWPFDGTPLGTKFRRLYPHPAL